MHASQQYDDRRYLKLPKDINGLFMEECNKTILYMKRWLETLAITETES